MIPLHVLGQYLRVEDASQGDLIEELERAAVAFVERETGRYFGPVQMVTEFFSGVAGQAILLRDEPTGAVTVEESTGTGWVTVTDYTRTGRFLYHTVAWSPYVDIRVTYQRGYAEGKEPGDIRGAVLQMTVHLYENRLPVAMGTIAGDVPLSVNDVIRKHRRLSV